MSKKAPVTPSFVFQNTDHLEGEVSETIYIRVDKIPDLLWIDNPKLHDLQKVWESIQRHGFRDKSAIDMNLTNKAGAKGAFVYGNGRLEATVWAWQEWARGNIKVIPRGYKYDDEYWYIPVEFGLDAKSEALAQDFGLIHNTSTMQGGDFTDVDLWSMYDKEALAELGKKNIP